MNLWSNILFFAGVLIAILLLKKKHVESVALKIFNTLVAKGIPENIALLAVAQAKHETAMGGVPFTSPLFLRANNAFGYGTVKGSPFQIGEAGKHPEDSGVYAKYPTVENSASDLAGYLNRRSKLWSTITTQESYANFLKNQHYFTGPTSHYVAGLNKFYQSTIV